MSNMHPTGIWEFSAVGEGWCNWFSLLVVGKDEANENGGGVRKEATDGWSELNGDR
ncbi:hypothetical protein HAX54_013620, partial [Datura stramonium]|nr:hypothetical protein [Datura stramonium]